MIESAATPFPDHRTPAAGGVAADGVAASRERTGGAAGERVPPGRRWQAPVITLVIGLIVTGVLAWLAQAQYASNEQRLLKLRVRDAQQLFTAAVPDIQTTLASAAELADATNGDPAKFRRFLAPSVGTARGKSFISASLWKLSSPERGPVAVVGAPPKLLSQPGLVSRFFGRAERVPTLAVVGLLSGPDPRLGYEYNTSSVRGGYAAYAEGALPPSRRSPVARNSPFSGLGYALYLGRDKRPANLLLASRSDLPLRGRTATVTVPFGDTLLTLVMNSDHPLSGSLPRDLPWIVAIVGLVLSLAAAAGALRLSERRFAAEQLAVRLEATGEEIRRLYAEQRGIAQTLQRALLPERLPQLPGMTIDARYVPGEQGAEVGGDWYDVIELGGRRVLLVVGDVSGHGVSAATTMAALRYAILAYTAQGDPPGEILTKLSDLLSVAEAGQMATILCALVDPDAGEVTLSSAGHLPPLVLEGAGGRYLECEVGIPIGIERGTAYRSTAFAVAESATLVAFTDGLVERRGESLDAGLARLRSAASGGARGELAALLDRLIAEVPRTPSEDDIALVGLAWAAPGPQSDAPAGPPAR